MSGVVEAETEANGSWEESGGARGEERSDDWKVVSNVERLYLRGRGA